MHTLFINIIPIDNCRLLTPQVIAVAVTAVTAAVWYFEYDDLPNWYFEKCLIFSIVFGIFFQNLIFWMSRNTHNICHRFRGKINFHSKHFLIFQTILYIKGNLNVFFFNLAWIQRQKICMIGAQWELNKFDGKINTYKKFLSNFINENKIRNRRTR